MHAVTLKNIDKSFGPVHILRKLGSMTKRVELDGSGLLWRAQSGPFLN